MGGAPIDRMKMGYAFRAPNELTPSKTYLGILLLFITIANTCTSVYALGGASLRHIHNSIQYDIGCRRILPLFRAKSCFVCSRFSKSMHQSRSSYWLTLQMSEYESTVIDSTSIVDDETNDENERDFFVCDAQFVHLNPAARILTEEFYSQRTNFITFQIERLKTVLSLESTFPGEYSNRPLQKMIVACDSRTGKVLGFAEVDARPLSSTASRATSIEIDTIYDASKSNEMLRSYMYNLAVDKKAKRRGIASALVRACEQFVRDAHDSCIEKRLYLRVRKSNTAAIALYENLDYKEMDPEEIQLSKDDINSGSLEEGELILFAKDLPLPTECYVD